MNDSRSKSARREPSAQRVGDGAPTQQKETVTTSDTREDNVLVPRRATLDGFAHEVALAGGVELAALDALTRMSVQTENTHYQLIVLGPPEPKVVLHGGRFFSDPTTVCLSGSSFGGNFLKMGWIGYGMRMEVYHDGRRIVTSPVRSIEILDDTHIPGPF